jgi:FkbM family methyltransferase
MNEDIYISTMKQQIESGIYDHLFHESGRHDLVFLDIGANIGLVSVYAVPFCKRIVAVEPSPDTFQKLTDNTKGYLNIERERVALSGHIGRTEFFVNDQNFTASSTVNTYGDRIEVEGTTLSKLLFDCELEHVDVCKIDAEGAEGDALNMAQLQEVKSKIDTYFIEFHNCPKSSWEHKLGTTVGNLARLGYHKMTIDGMALTASR